MWKELKKAFDITKIKTGVQILPKKKGGGRGETPLNTSSEAPLK